MKRTASKSVKTRGDGDGESPMPAELVTAEPAPWSVGWKAVVSAFVLFHLVAVAVFPLAFASQNASPAVVPVADVMRPYGKALYMDHGYFFFAPNPGPSHLVRYRLEFDDGRPTVEGQVPDIKRHWPRLLYHRHFMLAEHLNAAFVPAEPPPEATPEQFRDWREARKKYERHLRSFQEHLLETYGADRVALVRVEHEIPTPTAFDEGMSLRDEKLYVPLDQPQTYARGESIQ